MADPIKRVETTHINEVTRTATGTSQWFLENRSQTHPISHNNKLDVFICGEEGFAAIAKDIKEAKGSIDLVCWGFDPGMELVRSGNLWPRGETYGDLLIDAGKRGVQVRLLVWYDMLTSIIPGTSPRNMPGYTHDNRPRKYQSGQTAADQISASNSVSMMERVWQPPNENSSALRKEYALVTPDKLRQDARIEYCWHWYQAAFKKLLKGISIRTRQGNADDIKASLAIDEQIQPEGAENLGMVRMGTHHQKPILIDYAHQDEQGEQGYKAIAYVMGLNSVTDYWDTVRHSMEEPLREQGGVREKKEAVQVGKGVTADAGFGSYMPYRDYACRIDGGKALVDIYRNFVTAWDRAGNDYARTASKRHSNTPVALLRPPQKGHSSVQIVRTQPEENQDKTIKEIYFQATDVATRGSGYLYVENQYFQYEEWAQRLISKRQAAIDGWKRGCTAAGKTMEQMPFMHVFIVMPVPERAQMIPRTYDTLAVLGQHGGTSEAQGGMTGQNNFIERANKFAAPYSMVDDYGRTNELPDVVKHANTINKPSTQTLQDRFGLNIATAMLQTCGVDQGRWRYREVYIHSKLLLVDDGFFTLGSANLNQRSMAVDSEINMATNDPIKAADLRRRVWMQLSGGTISGDDGTREEVRVAFTKWRDLMQANKIQKKKNQKMTGFLLPLWDNRSSRMRLG